MGEKLRFHTDPSRSIYCLKSHRKISRNKVIEYIRENYDVEFIFRFSDGNLEDRTEDAVRKSALHVFKHEILPNMDYEKCLAWIRNPK